MKSDKNSAPTSLVGNNHPVYCPFPKQVGRRRGENHPCSTARPNTGSVGILTKDAVIHRKADGTIVRVPRFPKSRFFHKMAGV